MTLYATYFFPKDKCFVPNDKAIEEGVSFLDDAYNGDLHYRQYDITPKKYSTPVYIDSGADFQEFSCPACKTRVTSWEDYADWWNSEAFFWGVRDENQIIKVPCCGAELPFNQLGIGEQDVGFAMFYICVTDAGEEVSDQQLQQLGAILGCGVRRIIQVRD